MRLKYSNVGKVAGALSALFLVGCGAHIGTDDAQLAGKVSSANISDGSCLFVQDPQQLETKNCLTDEPFMLDIINAVRSGLWYCRGQEYPAAPAMQWNDDLAEAARVHARDMASNDCFGHFGSDHGEVTTRADNTNYIYSIIGENIAAGQTNSADAVNDWLHSTTGHCELMMEPNYQDVGVACMYNPNSEHEYYWVLVSGTE